jgi:hypothetical protein
MPVGESLIVQEGGMGTLMSATWRRRRRRSRKAFLLRLRRRSN